MDSCNGGVLALLSSVLTPFFFYIFNGYVEVKLADWLAFAGDFSCKNQLKEQLISLRAEGGRQMRLAGGRG